MGVDEGKGMRGEENGSVAVRFKVDTTVVPLSFVVEVLDTSLGA